jgi:hypothetical protein
MLTRRHPFPIRAPYRHRIANRCRHPSPSHHGVRPRYTDRRGRRSSDRGPPPTHKDEAPVHIAVRVGPTGRQTILIPPTSADGIHVFDGRRPACLGRSARPLRSGYAEPSGHGRSEARSCAGQPTQPLWMRGRQRQISPLIAAIAVGAPPASREFDDSPSSVRRFTVEAGGCSRSVIRRATAVEQLCPFVDHRKVCHTSHRYPSRPTPWPRGPFHDREGISSSLDVGAKEPDGLPVPMVRDGSDKSPAPPPPYSRAEASGLGSAPVREHPPGSATPALDAARRIVATTTAMSPTGSARSAVTAA